MKKLIFSAAAGIVLCAASFTDYTVYENQTALKQSDLMIKNLEALTQGETVKIPCSRSGDVCIYPIEFADGSKGTEQRQGYKNV